MSLLDPILRSPRAKQLSDRLAASLKDEAERRQRFRDEKNEKEKSEWLNGEVFVHSPVKLEHGTCSGRTFKLVDAVAEVKNLGLAGIEKFMVELTRNDVEPDVCFWRFEVAATFQRKQMLFPPPDLIVEVLSPSTQKNDRELKFDDYAAHGIKEYWIIDPDAEFIEQYVLRENGEFELRTKASNGTIRSPVLGNVDLPVRAFFDRDENLAAVRAILT